MCSVGCGRVAAGGLGGGSGGDGSSGNLGVGSGGRSWWWRSYFVLIKLLKLVVMTAMTRELFLLMDEVVMVGG